MLTLLAVSSIFVGLTFAKSYLAGPHFCSGKAVRLGAISVGFDPQDQQIAPYKHGNQPTGFYTQGDPQTRSTVCTSLRSTCHKSHFTREEAADQMDSKTATHALREPEQLKCTWTCHKTATSRANSQVKFRKSDGSHARDPQCERACAVEMHVRMSQEPFYARIHR